MMSWPSRSASPAPRGCRHRSPVSTAEANRQKIMMGVGRVSIQAIAARLLLLAAGEGHAPLSDKGIIAFEKEGTGFLQAGSLHRGSQLVIRQVLGGDAQVLPPGCGKKIRLLQHDPDPAAQVVQADLRDIRSADGDRPFSGGRG